MSLPNHIQLASKLKQLPRIGQTNTNFGSIPDAFGANPAEWEAQAKAIANVLNNFFDENLQRTALFRTDMTRLLGGVFTGLVQQFTYLEERNRSLNYGFGLTSKQASYLGNDLDELSKSTSSGGETLRKYTVSLKGLTGGFIIQSKTIDEKLVPTLGRYGKSLLETQDFMRENLKLTDQVAESYELFAAGRDEKNNDDATKNELVYLKQISEEIERKTNMSGTFKDLLASIGEMTADIQLQYGRINGQLELGILKSRALGFSMKQMHDTGNNLLDIEASIGKELEYQLLSGHRLIGNAKASEKLRGKSLTNAYREATIQGKAADQADILNQILKQEGDALRNNMFLRKQMADLLSMDEATLGRALQKQHLLKKVGAEQLMSLEGEDFQKALSELQKKYKNNEFAEEFSQLMDLADNRTSADRTAKAVEKLVDLQILDLMYSKDTTQMQQIADDFETFKKYSDPKNLEGPLNSLQGTLETFLPQYTTFMSLARAGGSIVSQGKQVVKGETQSVANPSQGSIDPYSTGTVNNDFILSSTGQVTSFSSEDSLMGFKPDGPIDSVFGNITNNSNTNLDANIIAAAVKQGIKAGLKEAGAIKATIDTPIGGFNTGRFA